MEKQKIREMGYQVVLWSLNSRDWVRFDSKFTVKHIAARITAGDIVLYSRQRSGSFN